MNVANALISIFLAFYFLIVAKAYLIPFVWALVVSFFIIEIASAYESIKIGKRHLTGWASMILSIGTIGLTFWLLEVVVNNNINEVITAAPVYQKKFHEIFDPLKTNPYIEKLNIDKMLHEFDFANVLSHVAKFVQNITGNLTMIFLYILFILLENRLFESKIIYILQKNKIFGKGGAKNVVRNIKEDLKKYAVIKSAASLATGILSYLIMKFFNIEFAALWAMLIFLLHFIPAIGSIIAVSFPVIMSIIQYYGQAGGTLKIALLTCLLVCVQMLIGNVVEPKVAGKTLNLSPLVLIISLVLWGAIWGVSGMFLCVPIMAIIKIIFSNIESTKDVALLLSANEAPLSEQKTTK